MEEMSMVIEKENVIKNPVVSRKTYSVITFIQAIVAFLIVFGIYYMNFGMATVPSSSMYPTLEVGSRFLYECVPADKLTYDDIVVFFPNAERDNPIDNGLESIYEMKVNHEIVYVKRVIGLPGDVLEMKDGYVYRNGEKLDPDYVAEPMMTRGETYVVPEGCLFCMGDNRNNSQDSRYIGAIPLNNFFGRLIINFTR